MNEQPARWDYLVSRHEFGLGFRVDFPFTARYYDSGRDANPGPLLFATRHGWGLSLQLGPIWAVRYAPTRTIHVAEEALR